MLRLIASPTGENNSVKIHADAKVYAGLFSGHQSAKLELDPKRKAYVHLVRGALIINDQKLTSGDALLIENESSLEISTGMDAEVLVFDLSH
jgi:redox-sensitive bicupin YhaK (pirin superfamily)